jgi:hypothetical protein
VKDVAEADRFLGDSFSADVDAIMGGNGFEPYLETGDRTYEEIEEYRTEERYKLRGAQVPLDVH